MELCTVNITSGVSASEHPQSSDQDTGIAEPIEILPLTPIKTEVRLHASHKVPELTTYIILSTFLRRMVWVLYKYFRTVTTINLFMSLALGRLRA
jgi:hypothetical protein